MDSLGASRGSESGVASRVLAQLLVEMDGCGSNSRVVLLAATNRPEALDLALTRPGRFDRLVHVPLPDLFARRQIFERQLGRMRLGEAPCAEALAERTEGYSGAEAVMVCREAALRAIRRGAPQGAVRAGHADFEEALQVVRPRVSKEAARFYEDFERRLQT